MARKNGIYVSVPRSVLFSIREDVDKLFTIHSRLFVDVQLLSDCSVLPCRYSTYDLSVSDYEDFFLDDLNNQLLAFSNTSTVLREHLFKLRDYIND